MKSSRRRFLKTAGVACAAAAPLSLAASTTPAADEPRKVTKAELDRILDTPVLDTSFLKRPVTVASIELLRNGRTFLVRARSTDGVEAVTVPNPARMRDFYRVFLGLAPVFVKKDARQLETLLWDAYRHSSNYKLQGLALWTIVTLSTRSRAPLTGCGRRKRSPMH